MLLKKTQKNHIFKLITSHNLNPSEFQFTVESKEQLLIKHVPTNFFFKREKITYFPYHVTFSPGLNEYEETHNVDNVDLVFDYLSQWVTYLEPEVNEPNLWDSFLNMSNSIRFEEETNDELFTLPEYRILLERLEQLNDRIINEFSLDSKQATYIDIHIRKLKEKSTELTKRDWFMYFMGFLQNTIVNLAFDPPKIEQLANTVREVFSYILQIR